MLIHTSSYSVTTEELGRTIVGHQNYTEKTLKISNVYVNILNFALY